MDDTTKSVLVLLVLGWAVLLLRVWRWERSGRKLLPPAKAVRRDGVGELPSLPTKPFEMNIAGPPAAPSEQAEAFDRYMVSDECDYSKLPGYRAHQEVNEPVEPSWREQPYAGRVSKLSRQREGGKTQ